MAYQHPSWGHIPQYVPMISSGMASLPASQPQTHSQETSNKQLEKYTLSFMQQPQHAKAANGKDKDRRPVDPPPILKLEVASDQDPDGVYKQSPYLIVVAYLEYGPGQDHASDAMPPANLMSGTMVSSLHRLKDPGDQEGAFFVFGDLTIRREGTYCLRFDLLQMEFGVSSEPDSLVTVTSVTSNPFRVYSQKNFPKQQKSESTFLTRSFSDQGVRLRVRKDSRLSLNRKRNSDKVMDNNKYDRKRMAVESPPQGRRPFPPQQHRGSLDATTDQYYESEMFPNEQANKRQRTGSGGMQVASHASHASPEQHALETRAWPSYQQHQTVQTATTPSYATQGPLGSMSTGPPTSAIMGAPQMPPPTTRLDTHFSSLHAGSSMYQSPVGEHQQQQQQQQQQRHSPITPSSVHHHSPFGSAGSQGSSLAYLYSSGMGQHGGGSSSSSSTGQTLNLAPVASHAQQQSVQHLQWA